MEVSFRVDCTPGEARRVIGGPDLLPLYQLAGDALEDWLLALIARLNPNALTGERAELEGAGWRLTRSSHRAPRRGVPRSR